MARDRRTGRYAHTWGWQGYDANGHQWEQCSHCGYWRDNSAGNQVRRNGPPQTWQGMNQTGAMVVDTLAAAQEA